MNLPDHRHVVMQAGGSRTSTVRMAHVKEQRALDLDGNWRIIEVVGRTWKIFAKKHRKGVPRCFQARKAGVTSWWQPRDFHRHIHRCVGRGIAANDKMKIIVVLTA